MYCPKCGETNSENVKFCSKCGASLTEEKKEIKNKEGLGKASLVIGIISLILSLTCIILLPIIISLPLSILGLVLGIVNVCKKGKKFVGIILNVLAMLNSLILGLFISPIILSLGIFAGIANEASKDGSDTNKFLNQLYNELDRGTSDNYVSGKYNCKSFDGTGANGDYIVRLELNDNNTFLWGKYNDTSRNYVKGTYSFKDLNKKDPSGQYAYYNIKLTGSEYYNNGIKQSEPYASEYEFGITAVATKKQGIIMNTKTYNMYYCYEEK